MAYSDKVIDHYENPRNVGSFDKGNDTVGTGMVGAPACGDVVSQRHHHVVNLFDRGETADRHAQARMGQLVAAT